MCHTKSYPHSPPSSYTSHMAVWFRILFVNRMVALQLTDACLRADTARQRDM
ncbi:hypothetical protein PISMIDRAFT_679215 [Pisolithus microcarpus 441]|uniref:Uncharacterized protein n=1 Tax=Pisolithus microcarpus 441 TaxID=765257 RepID=A0A0C9Z3A4_9AGAM|nr:hypothetical protein PISMIDRAFT_679215 [Pisolithus microcarpus 441]